MSDLEGFACLVTYQGKCFLKWKECSFLCHMCVCLPACLPACRVIVCVCEGICILFSKTEIHILAYCPWAQTGTLFSIELYPSSDLFWNLDLFVKYSNIGAKTTFGMLSYSHGNVVCGCSHSSEWKWLPGAFLPLVWILQNYTQLLQCAVLLCCYKMGFDWKCNPENGFKISCFVWYVLEPPRFLHLVFTTLMRRKIQTDFFFSIEVLFCFVRFNNYLTCLKKRALKSK